LITGYIRATSVAEAVSALEENKSRGWILAGGTDILQKSGLKRYKKSNPVVLIDIKRIEELKGIRVEEGWLVIGPATTLDELVKNGVIQAVAPVLVQAAEQVGSTEIRNRATVGGNLGTKRSSADLLIPLVGLKAEAEICDPAGRRKLLIEELLRKGLEELGRRMLITAIKIPVPQPTAWGYRRWSRESMGRAYLSAMVSLERGLEEGTYRVNVVLGGAGLWPCGYDAVVPEGKIFDRSASASLVEQIIQEKLGDATSDRDSYKRRLAPVILGEALEMAVKGVRA
jgi:CO/xanthine dehydrogenase FAD-binding subunit